MSKIYVRSRSFTFDLPIAQKLRVRIRKHTRSTKRACLLVVRQQDPQPNLQRSRPASPDQTPFRLAVLLERGVRQLLGAEVRITPVPRIDNTSWRWHVGLDVEATALLNDLYAGTLVATSDRRASAASSACSSPTPPRCVPMWPACRSTWP